MRRAAVLTWSILPTRRRSQASSDAIPSSCLSTFSAVDRGTAPSRQPRSRRASCCAARASSFATEAASSAAPVRRAASSSREQVSRSRRASSCDAARAAAGAMDAAAACRAASKASSSRTLSVAVCRSSRGTRLSALRRSVSASRTACVYRRVCICVRA